ncbi:hypothetical protein D0T53_07025 [Dysgonomonas sp. 216]|uniref:hypothetical protein n=1 Tax=Dysgonomonas sp. 216 TaxID=2302934 RepID=UPI0013D31CD5|nr:hypothetical protein [Dysgonomonas sp. 216]NDW18298.1 hypothetical protein [Dysgonomonas sp. 216]NDW18666.1 hypothetical protein [Dysgonomonas sp. 216]
MVRIKIFFVLTAVLFIFVSCLGDKIESDAIKAVELTNASLQYTEEKNLESAERAYLEFRRIIEKYEKAGQGEEFYNIYNNYLLNPEG